MGFTLCLALWTNKLGSGFGPKHFTHKFLREIPARADAFAYKKLLQSVKFNSCLFSHLIFEVADPNPFQTWLLVASCSNFTPLLGHIVSTHRKLDGGEKGKAGEYNK